MDGNGDGQSGGPTAIGQGKSKKPRRSMEVVSDFPLEFLDRSTRESRRRPGHGDLPAADIPRRQGKFPKVRSVSSLSSSRLEAKLDLGPGGGKDWKHPKPEIKTEPQEPLQPAVESPPSGLGPNVLVGEDNFEPRGRQGSGNGGHGKGSNEAGAQEEEGKEENVEEEKQVAVSEGAQTSDRAALSSKLTVKLKLTNLNNGLLRHAQGDSGEVSSPFRGEGAKKGAKSGSGKLGLEKAKEQSRALAAALADAEKEDTEVLLQEVDVLRRADAIRANQRVVAGRKLPKHPEPPRAKTHWDHLLEEMAWLAKDFSDERKWKRKQARLLASRASKSQLDMEARESRRHKEEDTRIRRIASSITKEVKLFWTKIEKLVVYKHQLQVEEKKKQALDKHLDFLLGQTERYSSMLAENLAESKVVPGADIQLPLPASPLLAGPAVEGKNVNDIGGAGEVPAAGESPGRRDAVGGGAVEGGGDDDDFQVADCDEAIEDDEQTLEMDEAAITAEERKEELDALQLESELPIEDLLGRYRAEAEAWEDEEGSSEQSSEAELSAKESAETATTEVATDGVEDMDEGVTGEANREHEEEQEGAGSRVPQGWPDDHSQEEGLTVPADVDVETESKLLGPLPGRSKLQRSAKEGEFSGGKQPVATAMVLEDYRGAGSVGLKWSKRAEQEEEVQREKVDVVAVQDNSKHWGKSVPVDGIEYSPASAERQEGDLEYVPGARLLNAEEDDEATLDEEEEQAQVEGGFHADDEMELLRRESEIPVSELLARYRMVPEGSGAEDGEEGGTESPDEDGEAESLETAESTSGSEEAPVGEKYVGMGSEDGSVGTGALVENDDQPASGTEDAEGAEELRAVRRGEGQEPFAVTEVQATLADGELVRCNGHHALVDTEIGASVKTGQQEDKVQDISGSDSAAMAAATVAMKRVIPEEGLGADLEGQLLHLGSVSANESNISAEVNVSLSAAGPLAETLLEDGVVGPTPQTEAVGGEGILKKAVEGLAKEPEDENLSSLLLLDKDERVENESAVVAPEQADTARRRGDRRRRRGSKARVVEGAEEQEREQEGEGVAAGRSSAAAEEEEGLLGLDMEAGKSNQEKLADFAAAAMLAQPTGYTLSTTTVRTKVPFLLKGTLREYQHIGLDWLVTMYEKRLNGILADEMGLGKTIMTIALLAHLACEKGIWGPHLIVVPTSVMLNWETEFMKWCPAFKILTYFGSAKERKLKRQGWSKPNSFHVCITTYRLVIQDAKAFRRKKWKYLILDEAHLIKNWKSQRWQTLLNFNSKRRILLTGTPLQNDLMELWSLMHFLMPHVFQSHQEFRDWFSNPITGMVEGQEQVNKEVVDRLHNVLRPFLLRRLKRDVEKQLPQKHEHVLRCRLSKRQRQLYEDFIASSDTRATLASGNFLGLINVLMQLRKVCNHPDLFESRPIVSSFDMVPPPEYHFSTAVATALKPRTFFEQTDLWELNLRVTSAERDMTAWEAVELAELATPEPLIVELATPKGDSWRAEGQMEDSDGPARSFIAEVQAALRARRREERRQRAAAMAYMSMQRCAVRPVYGADLRKQVSLEIMPRDIHRIASDPRRYLDYPDCLTSIVQSPLARIESCRSLVEAFIFAIPAARASAPVVWCSHPVPSDARACREMEESLRNELLPLLAPLRPAIVRHQLFFPDRRLLQFDCGKLQELAVLLRRLHAEGHRALIFTQMTKMLDVLESFISLYGYTYMRLDGSTKPEQRQILMQRFNTNPKVFLFILSTRSGGVGINLVGADTVIFYDSDWNPAMDLQAQDRCHRIGQTREVNIYRLVSESTIEENILRKANQKRVLDDLVIQSGGYNTEFFQRLDPRELFSGIKGIQIGDKASSAVARDGVEAILPDSAEVAEVAEGGAPSKDVPSSAEVEAALRSAEDEADYMAMKQVEQEDAAEKQEFTEEVPLGALEEDEGAEGEGEDVAAVAAAAAAGDAAAQPSPAGTLTREKAEALAEVTRKFGKEGPEGQLALIMAEGADEDMDMLADVRQMAAVAAATGAATVSFEDRLRPIERYAMRFMELWDPIVDRNAAEAIVVYEEQEWELEQLEKLKTEQEAEIDEDNEPLAYENWDTSMADEAYRLQVETLKQQEEEKQKGWEAEDAEQAARAGVAQELEEQVDKNARQPAPGRDRLGRLKPAAVTRSEDAKRKAKSKALAVLAGRSSSEEKESLQDSLDRELVPSRGPSQRKRKAPKLLEEEVLLELYYKRLRQQHLRAKRDAAAAAGEALSPGWHRKQDLLDAQRTTREKRKRMLPFGQSSSLHTGKAVDGPKDEEGAARRAKRIRLLGRRPRGWLLGTEGRQIALESKNFLVALRAATVAARDGGSSESSVGADAWSAAEDALLCALVHAYGAPCWRFASEVLATAAEGGSYRGWLRSPDDCRQRFRWLLSLHAAQATGPLMVTPECTKRLVGACISGTESQHRLQRHFIAVLEARARAPLDLLLAECSHPTSALKSGGLGGTAAHRATTQQSSFSTSCKGGPRLLGTLPKERTCELFSAPLFFGPESHASRLVQEQLSAAAFDTQVPGSTAEHRLVPGGSGRGAFSTDLVTSRGHVAEDTYELDAAEELHADGGAVTPTDFLVDMFDGEMAESRQHSMRTSPSQSQAGSPHLAPGDRSLAAASVGAQEALVEPQAPPNVIRPSAAEAAEERLRSASAVWLESGTPGWAADATSAFAAADRHVLSQAHARAMAQLQAQIGARRQSEGAGGAPQATSESRQSVLRPPLPPPPLPPAPLPPPHAPLPRSWEQAVVDGCDLSEGKPGVGGPSDAEPSRGAQLSDEARVDVVNNSSIAVAAALHSSQLHSSDPSTSTLGSSSPPSTRQLLGGHQGSSAALQAGESLVSRPVVWRHGEKIDEDARKRYQDPRATARTPLRGGAGSEQKSSRVPPSEGAKWSGGPLPLPRGLDSNARPFAPPRSPIGGSKKMPFFTPSREPSHSPMPRLAAPRTATPLSTTHVSAAPSGHPGPASEVRGHGARNSPGPSESARERGLYSEAQASRDHADAPRPSEPARGSRLFPEPRTIRDHADSHVHRGTHFGASPSGEARQAFKGQHGDPDGLREGRSGSLAHAYSKGCAHSDRDSADRRERSRSQENAHAFVEREHSHRPMHGVDHERHVGEPQEQARWSQFSWPSQGGRAASSDTDNVYRQYGNPSFPSRSATPYVEESPRAPLPPPPPLPRPPPPPSPQVFYTDARLGEGAFTSTNSSQWSDTHLPQLWQQQQQRQQQQFDGLPVEGALFVQAQLRQPSHEPQAHKTVDDDLPILGLADLQQPLLQGGREEDLPDLNLADLAGFNSAPQGPPFY